MEKIVQSVIMITLKKVQGFDTDDTRQLIVIGAKMSSRKHRMCLKSHLLSCTITFEPRMRKSVFCIYENKGADQLRGNRAADPRLCVRCIPVNSTIPLLPKSKISSFLPSSVVVQSACLCRT